MQLSCQLATGHHDFEIHPQRGNLTQQALDLGDIQFQQGNGPFIYKEC